MHPVTTRAGPMEHVLLVALRVIIHPDAPAEAVVRPPATLTEGEYDAFSRKRWLIVVRRRGEGGGGANPGNNLHVSGLSHRVDTRDLEQAFAKIGRVSFS